MHNRLLPGLMIAPLVFLLACKEETKAAPELVIDTEALDFGEVASGSEAEMVFTLTNAGGGEVQLLSVQLTGGELSIWDVDRDGDLLAGGESVAVTVTFKPQAELEYLGRVQVRHDDADAPTYEVDLSGSGGASTADNDGDGYSTADGDCDDSRDTVYPGAEEICDGRDNDCDGSAGADEADDDGDGVRICDGDCDDTDSNVYPDAPEICDDKDSDCDGVNADNEDRDGDGFTPCDNDCDDDEAAAYPGSVEVCDEVDNDCDGEVDGIDFDLDGHSICHPAGDCDDTDAQAYPIVVDASAPGGGDGSDEDPFIAFDDAYAALDEVCRTIYLAEGSYSTSMSLDAESLTVMGAGDASVLGPAADGELIFSLVNDAELELIDLSLAGANHSAGDGGAIAAVDASIIATGVLFDSNRSGADGGAIALSSGSAVFEDCSFVANTATDDGGAIAAIASDVSFSECSFTGNAGIRGGALLAETTSLDISDSELSDNDASDEGGGLSVVGGSVSIERNVVSLNTAVNGGGGVALNDLSTGAVRNNIIQDNDGGSIGGGLLIGGSSAGFSLANNTLYANVCTGNGAGIAVDATDASGLEIVSNLVTWSDGASGLYTSGVVSASSGWNTAYATSSSTNYSGAVISGVADNTTEDPLFTAYSDDRDPSNDDFSLSSGSPAKDSGPPFSAFNDPDGTQNDRGHTGGPGAN